MGGSCSNVIDDSIATISFRQAVIKCISIKNKLEGSKAGILPQRTQGYNWRQKVPQPMAGIGLMNKIRC